MTLRRAETKSHAALKVCTVFASVFGFVVGKDRSTGAKAGGTKRLDKGQEK